MRFQLEALPVEDDTEAEKGVEEDKVYLGNNTGPLLIYFDSVHTVKKVSDFAVPSQDVTYLFYSAVH
jgi:hypothetical protein